MANSSIEVRVLERDEYPMWDAFVKTSPQGTIFGSSLWADIVQEAMGPGHAIYGCFKGQELVGGSSVFYRSLGPLRMMVCPPLTRYHGLLVRDQSAIPPTRRSTLEERVFEALSARLNQDFRRIELSIHPTMTDIRPAQRLGWRERTLYTYVTDLSDPARLWDSVEGGAKRLVAKAEKAGLAVRESSDLRAFQDLHTATFERQGVQPPVAPTALAVIHERLSREDLCRIFLAEDANGQVYAAAYVIWWKRAYYLMGASDDRLKSSGAFSLTLWKVLETLAGKQPELDLFGANIPSIAQFKKDFATSLLPYHDLTNYSFPLIEQMEACRAFMRTVTWRGRLRHARMAGTPRSGASLQRRKVCEP